MTGHTRYSDRAISKIVNAAAAVVPGVFCVSSSWADIGTRSYPRSEVRVDHTAASVQVDAVIAVSWPSPITAVAAQVQDNIREWVRAYTGLRVTQVDVLVEHAEPSDSRVTSRDLTLATQTPAITPVKQPLATPVRQPRTTTAAPVRLPQLRPNPVNRAFPDGITPGPLPDLMPLRPITVPVAVPLRPVALPPAQEVRHVYP